MRSSSGTAEHSKHGVGIVWWPELEPLCRPGEGLVHVTEFEPEAFWMTRADPSGGFISRLPEAVGHLAGPKLFHCVGAPFGGAVAQPAPHLEALLTDIAKLAPAWISDHLSFNRYFRGDASTGEQPVLTGFFLPPAQCRAGVLLAAKHIQDRRSATGVPVAFENSVSYLPPRPGEMPDADFVAEVAEAADCGILLDLHNVLCNARNGRQSVEEFCASIPLDRVWEIHLAGGMSERGFWLDAHSGLVEPALMEVVADLIPRLPALGAIIFEIMPDFIPAAGLSAIGEVLGRLNDLWGSRPSVTHPIHRGPWHVPTPEAAEPVTPDVWERALGDAVTGLDGNAPAPALDNWMRSAAEALELYRYLSREGRASFLVDTAPRTIRSLLIALGEADTRNLLARFWSRTAPAFTTADEAHGFLDFVSRADLRMPGLIADIDSDRAGLRQLAGT
jgi:uncharacterized protein (UPF0276 family)